MNKDGSCTIRQEITLGVGTLNPEMRRLREPRLLSQISSGLPGSHSPFFLAGFLCLHDYIEESDTATGAAQRREQHRKGSRTTKGATGEAQRQDRHSDEGGTRKGGAQRRVARSAAEAVAYRQSREVGGRDGSRSSKSRGRWQRR